jgi:hypothetical protein
VDEGVLLCSAFPVKLKRAADVLPVFALFLLPVGFALALKIKLAKK